MEGGRLSAFHRLFTTPPTSFLPFSRACTLVMSTAFVYGTLMFPAVLQALIKRVPRSQPATIRGFRRHRIQEMVFPGTVAAEAESVRGVLATNGRGGCTRCTHRHPLARRQTQAAPWG